MAHLGKSGCQPSGHPDQKQRFLSKAAPAADSASPPNAGRIELTQPQERILGRILDQALAPTAAWTRKR